MYTPSTAYRVTVSKYSGDKSVTTYNPFAGRTLNLYSSGASEDELHDMQEQLKTCASFCFFSSDFFFLSFEILC